jgi:Fe-S-cluster containining protein
VLLDDAEITRLAAFKQMSEHDFIQRFARLRPDRRGLALKENADGSCIFLEGDSCAVQPVKPQKCKEFPNLWNFPGFEKVCHAIPREVSEEEYARRIGLVKAKGQ